MSNEKKTAGNKTGKTKPGNDKKGKKKVTAASIDNIITSPVNKARVNSAGSHTQDGTWVSYEEDK